MNDLYSISLTKKSLLYDSVAKLVDAGEEPTEENYAKWLDLPVNQVKTWLHGRAALPMPENLPQREYLVAGDNYAVTDSSRDPYFYNRVASRMAANIWQENWPIPFMPGSWEDIPAEFMIYARSDGNGDQFDDPDWDFDGERRLAVYVGDDIPRLKNRAVVVFDQPGVPATADFLMDYADLYYDRTETIPEEKLDDLKAMQSFVKLIHQQKTAREARIQEARTEIKLCLGQVRDRRGYLIKSIRDLAKAHEKVKEVEEDAKKPMGVDALKIMRAAESINLLSSVKSCVIDASSSGKPAFKIDLHPYVMERRLWDEDEEEGLDDCVVFDQLKLKLVLSDEVTESVQWRMGEIDGSPHPHVSHAGDHCWGDGEPRMAECIARKDWLGAMLIVQGWICSYNEDSPHVEISNWASYHGPLPPGGYGWLVPEKEEITTVQASDAAGLGDMLRGHSQRVEGRLYDEQHIPF